MNIRPALLTCVLAVTLASPVAVFAQHSASVHGHSRPRLSECTFRLQLEGRATPGMTYWVAYGPLGGRFGLIRLKSVGHGLFVGSRSLPFGARSEFAYVAGWGTVHTRAGLAPGGKPVTIRVVGPVRVFSGSMPVVDWRAPVG